MNICLEETEIKEWMTKEETNLIQKDLQKGTVSNNCRPIMFQPMMWEIQTVQFWEENHYSLIRFRLFPEEQKGYHKGTRRIRDQQYIDQHILKDIRNH